MLYKLCRKGKRCRIGERNGRCFHSGFRTDHKRINEIDMSTFVVVKITKIAYFD